MLYIQRSDGAYVSFTGMTPDTITAMLAVQSLTCTFIDKATFDAATAPH